MVLICLLTCFGPGFSMLGKFSSTALSLVLQFKSDYESSKRSCYSFDLQKVLSQGLDKKMESCFQLFMLALRRV